MGASCSHVVALSRASDRHVSMFAEEMVDLFSMRRVWFFPLIIFSQKTNLTMIGYSDAIVTTPNYLQIIGLKISLAAVTATVP